MLKMQKVRDVKIVTRLLHAKMQYPASLGSSFETYMVGNTRIGESASRKISRGVFKRKCFLCA